MADSVSILTKIEGEPIEQYLFGVCSNHTARIVKFADSLFNYKECVKCGDLKRAEKYKRNLEVLHDKQTMVSLGGDIEMKYKPENVKLVIAYDGVEREVGGFDESTCSDECSIVTEEQIEWLLDRVSKTKEKPKKSKTKSSRCKDTIDWVEEEYGDAYEKPYVNKKVKKDSQSCKQSSHGCNQIISSTLVKHLTKSDIESLRQNKRDAYALMMKMN